jgi:Flp pilus assembly secretin CpaC
MNCFRWISVTLLLLSFAARADEVPSELKMTVGESRLLNVDLRRAALGSGKVVSLATPEKGQLLVFGEAAGETTAQLWLRNGALKSLRIICFTRYRTF